MTPPVRDAETLIAWLREAADELENAHAVLDLHDVPRDLTDDGVDCTLAARIAIAMTIPTQPQQRASETT